MHPVHVRRQRRVADQLARQMRAERAVVRLFDEGHVENPALLAYLNRLSSLLFVLSRYEDALGGQSAVRLAKGDDTGA